MRMNFPSRSRRAEAAGTRGAGGGRPLSWSVPSAGRRLGTALAVTAGLVAPALAGVSDAQASSGFKKFSKAGDFEFTVPAGTKRVEDRKSVV